MMEPSSQPTSVILVSGSRAQAKWLPTQLSPQLKASMKVKDLTLKMKKDPADRIDHKKDWRAEHTVQVVLGQMGADDVVSGLIADVAGGETTQFVHCNSGWHRASVQYTVNLRSILYPPATIPKLPQLPSSSHLSSIILHPWPSPIILHHHSFFILHHSFFILHHSSIIHWAYWRPSSLDPNDFVLWLFLPCNLQAVTIAAQQSGRCRWAANVQRTAMADSRYRRQGARQA